MSPVEGPRPKKYHPDRRRELLVLADVRLFQARVIDKDGEETAIVIWQCGPDILVSRTMEGFFNGNGRVNAPRWLREQLESLPHNRRFHFDGSSYLHDHAREGEMPSVAPVATELPESAGEPEEEGKDELGGFQEG